MQVETAEDSNVSVPLHLFDGDNAEVVASRFAAANGLDSNTRDELVMAIVEYAKRRGTVPPLFAVSLQLPDGSKSPLNVYKGDKPAELAQIFVARHGLLPGTVEPIREEIVRRARAGGHMQPLLKLDVKTPAGVKALLVYEGEMVGRVVAEFAEREDLEAAQVLQLQLALREELKVRQLVQPLLEITVDLGKGAQGVGRPRRVTLAVYDGETVEQVAAEFATEHGLAWKQQQAVQLLLDDALTQKGLLPPLLFTQAIGLPARPPDLAVESATIPVHAGDDPSAVAAQFVAAHAGRLWPALEATKAWVADAIRARLAAVAPGTAGAAVAAAADEAAATAALVAADDLPPTAAVAAAAAPAAAAARDAAGVEARAGAPAFQCDTPCSFKGSTHSCMARIAWAKDHAKDEQAPPPPPPSHPRDGDASSRSPCD
jgi:hypothetical protein